MLSQLSYDPIMALFLSSFPAEHTSRLFQNLFLKSYPFPLKIPGHICILWKMNTGFTFSFHYKNETTQKGLEPSTSAVTGRRSNQLSHWALFLTVSLLKTICLHLLHSLKQRSAYSGPSGTRTRDRPVMSRLLWPTELKVRLSSWGPVRQIRT